MKRIVQRHRRHTDDVGFAKIADHSLGFQRFEKFSRPVVSENRKLAAAPSGITGTSGAYLDGNVGGQPGNGTFAILPGGRGIVR